MSAAAATRQRKAGVSPRPARARSASRSSARRRGAVSRQRVFASQGGAVALPRLGLNGLGALGRRAVALPDTSLIERLASGRKWILLLTLLLFGIVALNVSLLETNAQIGNMAKESQTLVRQNARLRSKLVKLSSPERIMKTAEARGFVAPEPSSIRYLTRYPLPSSGQRQALLRAASFAGQ